MHDMVFSQDLEGIDELPEVDETWLFAQRALFP